MDSLDSFFLLFHPGSAAVSSGAVEIFIYRLFTVDGSLGKTAPEKLIYFKALSISLSILRKTHNAIFICNTKMLIAT
jgi:hypothetical protein